MSQIIIGDRILAHAIGPYACRACRNECRIISPQRLGTDNKKEKRTGEKERAGRIRKIRRGFSRYDSLESQTKRNIKMKFLSIVVVPPPAAAPAADDHDRHVDDQHHEEDPRAIMFLVCFEKLLAAILISSSSDVEKSYFSLSTLKIASAHLYIILQYN
jgi:hypothetical protein